MLVRGFVATVIVWVVRAIIVFAAMWVGGSVMMRADRTHNKILSGLGGAILLAGVVALFFSGRFAGGTPVLFARPSGEDVVRADSRLYGSTTYRFSDGRAAVIRGGARQVVVNDTPMRLVVSSILYSGARGEKPPDVRIEPYSIGRASGRIDHFGFNDQAPARSKKQVRLRLWWERPYP